MRLPERTADPFEIRRVIATGSVLSFNGPDGSLVGTCDVPGTGGRQGWTGVTCPVNGAAGTHDLYPRFTGATAICSMRTIGEPPERGCRHADCHKDITAHGSSSTSRSSTPDSGTVSVY